MCIAWSFQKRLYQILSFNRVLNVKCLTTSCWYRQTFCGWNRTGHLLQNPSASSKNHPQNHSSGAGFLEPFWQNGKLSSCRYSKFDSELIFETPKRRRQKRTKNLHSAEMVFKGIGDLNIAYGTATWINRKQTLRRLEVSGLTLFISLQIIACGWPKSMMLEITIERSLNMNRCPTKWVYRSRLNWYQQHPIKNHCVSRQLEIIQQEPISWHIWFGFASVQVLDNFAAGWPQRCLLGFGWWSKRPWVSKHVCAADEDECALQCGLSTGAVVQPRST